MAAGRPVQLTIQDQAIARVTEQRDALAQDYTHLLNESALVCEQYDALRQRFTAQAQRLEQLQEQGQRVADARAAAVREGLMDSAHNGSRQRWAEEDARLSEMLGVKNEQ